MLDTQSQPRKKMAGWILLALALPLLAWSGTTQTPAESGLPIWLPWHNILESLSAVAAALICITGYRAILSPRKGATILLGILFLGVGLLGLLHVNATTNPRSAAFFDLGADLLATMALLLYALLPGTPDVSPARRRLALALMLSSVAVLAAVGLFWSDRLPPLPVAGDGPTWLIGGWGGLLATLNLATTVILWFKRQDQPKEADLARIFTAALLACAALFSAVSELTREGSLDVLTHLCRIAAYLLLFHATFNEALRRPYEQMEKQYRREKLLLDASPDGVLWVGADGRILKVNPSMAKLSGYTAEEMVGENVNLLLPLSMRARHEEFLRNYFAAPKERPMSGLDLKLMRRDGSLVPVDISLTLWSDEDERCAIAYVHDLSERQKFEESLRYQATHDELTGLPNRWLFNLQLGQALAQARRTERSTALLLLDLDGFKAINDSLGHACGDELLNKVAARLRSVLRQQDTLARLGGDEFVLLLPELETSAEAVSVAQKLLAALASSFQLENHHEVHTGCSIGLSFFPEDAQDGDHLLRYADMAMYQAKQAGRGNYACYSAELDRNAHDNLTLINRLKETLTNQRGNLRLHYQPQVDIDSGQVAGVEALLRWHDPVLGEVSPVRFVPAAESAGLIVPLSDWVLETACRQAVDWMRIGLNLRVAINFSVQQIRQPDLPQKVQAILTRTGLRADMLEVEITEAMAMLHPLKTREQLVALSAMGCSVTLDDFGTGYSSLAYLKGLPISKLKIDRSFIADLSDDPNNVKIAGSIIALAHSLGLGVVAEGVETHRQLDFLRQHGCESFQGWLFAKALEPSEIPARLH